MDDEPFGVVDVEGGFLCRKEGAGVGEEEYVLIEF